MGYAVGNTINSKSSKNSNGNKSHKTYNHTKSNNSSKFSQFRAHPEIPVEDVCGTQCHQIRTKLISAIVIWYDINCAPSCVARSTATSSSPGAVSGLGI